MQLSAPVTTLLAQAQTQFYHHLLWKKLWQAVEPSRQAALERFGERYGKEAVQQRLLGELERTGVDFTAWQREARQGAKRLAISLIERYSEYPHYFTMEAVKIKTRRNKGVERFERSVEPLLTVIRELEFVNDILGRYFSSQEIMVWDKRFETESRDIVWQAMVAELEKRSGQKLASHLRALDERVVKEMGKLFVGISKDYVDLVQRGGAMVTSLEEERLGDLTRLIVRKD